MNLGSTIAALVGLVVIFSLLYALSNPEKKALNDAARARLGGSYIHLSGGVTHYRWDGPVSGPTVVLVHGGITPMITWDAYIPALVAAGFHVLRYDQYGRGYSDRPHVAYDRLLFRRQLLDLLDGLNLSPPVDVVGYSGGGAIATDFTACFPERIRRLALIAPLVLDFGWRPYFRTPVLGAVLARLTALREAVNLARAADLMSERDRKRLAARVDQATYHGFQYSLVAASATDAWTNYLDSYRAVGRQERRVLLLRGTRDPTISQEAIDTVRELIPQVEFHALPNSTHDIVFDDVDRVCPLLIGFLRRNAAINSLPC